MENNKKIRVIIASILIVIGIVSLLFWEMWGREYVTYDKVIVAAQNIRPGDTITEDMLTEKGVQKDNIISRAIRKEDLQNVVGMISKQNVIKGSQLHMSYFTAPEKYLSKGESIYKIHNGWIASCSSSVRRGDIVEIYGVQGDIIGKFKVAFVKDVQEREVTSINNKKEETLDRIESTGIINNIEIIATLEVYNNLKQRAYDQESKTGEKFTIVQIFK